MELDELKNTWAALDERLKQNESLNIRIVKEMLETKNNKSLSRILYSEIIGTIVLLAVIPFIIFISVDSRFIIKDKNLGAIFLVGMFFFCILAFLWQLFKVYNLIKVDFSSFVSDNIRIINRYNIWIKREKLISWFSIPVIGLFCTYIYAQFSVSILLWVFLTCIFILATLLTYYQYKKVYDKNISSILKSLDELKELEE